MKILINCSNLKVGGGLQVAHSFLYELKELHFEHQYIVVVSAYLAYQINFTDFPSNFKFYNYTQKASALKCITGKDAFLDDLEQTYNPKVVFTIFGPSYWQPNAPHFCGFARPHYIYKTSPYFNSLSLKEKVKLRLMEFFHMYDFKNNNEALITENDDVSEILKQRVNQRVFTVSNTFNQIFEDKSKWDTKTLLDIPENVVKMLTISANYPHKNLDVIKKLVPFIKSNFPDFKFVFILTITAEEFGIDHSDLLNENIIFLGKVTIKQCPSLYHQSDFLFLPTLLECFSASYLEAMCMQKPILTSNLSFATGICGDAASYFDPIDINDIANKIVDLSSDIAYQKELVEKGKVRLTHFYSSKERAQKYIEIITNKDAIQK
jgi:glycosyltransferase involved in cell wall biosynthesis